MRKFKNYLSGTLFIVLLHICPLTNGQSLVSKNIGIKPVSTHEKSLDFFIVSDWGRNGFINQQDVADQMVKSAENIEPKFIISCGDNFQVNGVNSTQDPLWMSSFENIYKHPSLHVDWYPVFGNHDYKGNTQAEIDYSKISRRWRMESHYYTFVKKLNDSISARFIFLDTPPLVSEYYNKEGYPDIIKQDSAKQMEWLKNVLANSKEQCKLVFGHHPVYSASSKHGDTKDLIQKLKPLFEKYNVNAYFCGHDHDLQHLKEGKDKVDYFVVGAGSEIRPNGTNSMSLFSKSVPGFSIISLYADRFQVRFIDKNGNTVYQTSSRYQFKK
ncbi:MAG: metallophosphoesterase [Bacteroidetes bacterium]|nr:metallophosphoesterase [Bacteroidota bacterium]